VYIGAKQIDIVDEKDQICKATHFTVIGLSLQAKKELLLSKTVNQRDSVEGMARDFMHLPGIHSHYGAYPHYQHIRRDK